MATPNSEVIGPVLVALVTGGFLRDVLKGFLQKKIIKSQVNKSEAEAAAVIVSTATSILAPLNLRMAEMNEELVHLREEVKEIPKLREQVRVLTERLEFYEQPSSGS
jgi:hypothetical protein